MSWPEKDQVDLKREHAEKNIMEYKKALFESGLLERIEKRRLEIEEKQPTHKLSLYPRLAYESNRDSDHFLKELSFLHTEYSVKHSGWYSSFCIKVAADGIYWESGKKTKKMKPEKVSDQEIHDWFVLLGKK